MYNAIRQWTALTVAAVSLCALATQVARAVEEETQPVKRLTYRDDFSDPKKVEADSETMNNVKVFPGIGLSSVNSNAGYVIYDLKVLFPTMADDAKVTLTYSGGANGPKEQRGVTWAVSTDGKEWADVSTNEFDKPTELKGRYLRASLRWVQAATPDYGFLKSFTLKTVAKAEQK